jgi:hypothetical protein
MKAFAFILLIGFSLRTNPQPISIDPEKLTWHDFHGAVDAKSNFMVYTYSRVMMSYNFNIKGTPVLVFACFFPDSSWVNWSILKFSQKQELDSLIIHERLHYYISILVAKKLKAYLAKHAVYSNKEALEVYIPFSNMLSEMRDRYDLETNNGLNHAMQNKWNLGRSPERMKNKTLSNLHENFVHALKSH